MTRQYRDNATQESPFKAWIRNEPGLDSVRHGLAVMDCDQLVHRYMSYGVREFQCVMWIEVKAFNARPTQSQRDTLFLLDQIFRNRRATPTSPISRRQAYDLQLPSKVWSLIAKREISLRAYGAHLLTMNADRPDTSEELKWDKTRIDYEMLLQLLRFELDPDTLAPHDLRSHHRQHETPLLWECAP